MAIDPTINPKARSWIHVDPESHFPIQNMPYGIFSRKHESKRACIAIGDHVLDLAVLYDEGLLSQGQIPFNVFALDRLNEFMACGKSAWTSTRKRLFQLLEEKTPDLRDNVMVQRRALIPIAEVQMHLPVFIGDYVDFYSSEQHATNVGSMFRPDNPLMPNWKHLPVGYNGRASSIVLSGSAIRRPCGQILPPSTEKPIESASKALDFELEVGFYTGKSSELGTRVPTSAAEEYIFGISLVNDWSARDIQRWEYQPLGPFLSKSFGTSVSPWVVTLDALAPWRIAGPKQSPPVLPYLKYRGKWRFDIQLEVWLQTQKMTSPQRISKTTFKNMYWNMAQQLAHQSVNGTNIQVGDLYASGTVSGDTPDSYGSMLELAWRGEKPIEISETGETRSFLQDGDVVAMTGWCQGDGYRVGFGECVGQILPAEEIA
jgi:fumarylacetoacetase